MCEEGQEESRARTSSGSTSASTTQHSKPAEASRAVILATPAAIRIAHEKNITLDTIKGSGPNGRILESDLTSYSQSSSTPSYTDIPTTTMRRAIATRMTEAKRDVPHYYLTSEIHMDQVISLRASLNKSAADQSNSAQGGQGPLKLTINDFVIKGVALACVDVPEVIAEWHGDFIRQFRSIDISVVVDTPTGLYTPFLTDVANQGLRSISSQMKSLAEKARNNTINLDEYQGGRFTISNLGMFGSVSHFTSIVKLPQACTFAIGSLDKKLVLDERSERGFKEIESMKVTLTCDHRVVDGALGARWLKAFKTHMENPVSFIL